MKRKTLRRLSILSAFVVLAVAPQYLPPAIEPEQVKVNYS